MPLSPNLLKKYQTDVFVETGTFQGEAVEFARALPFKEIHSIELNGQMARDAASRFAGDKRVHIHQGSSDLVLHKILPKITGSVTIWLDAHPITDPLTLARTPLDGELRAIAGYLPGLQVRAVLIDDMRVFNEAERVWLTDRLREIFPTYDVFREPSRYASDDILTAAPKAGVL